MFGRIDFECQVHRRHNNGHLHSRLDSIWPWRNRDSSHLRCFNKSQSHILTYCRPRRERCVNMQTSKRSRTANEMHRQKSANPHSNFTSGAHPNSACRASQKNTPNGPPCPLSPLNTTPTINSAIQPSGTKKTPQWNGLPPATQNGKTPPCPTNPLTTTPNPGNSTLKSRQSDKSRPTKSFIRGSSIFRKSWRPW